MKSNDTCKLNFSKQLKAVKRQVERDWIPLGDAYAHQTVLIHIAVIKLYRAICSNLDEAREFAELAASAGERRVRKAVMTKLVREILDVYAQFGVVDYLMKIERENHDWQDRMYSPEPKSIAYSLFFRDSL
jgi:hypothetical protein